MSTMNPRERREAAAPPLLSLRLLALVTTSLVVGFGVAALTWLTTGQAATSTLAGLSSAGVALDRLHRWTGP